MAASNTRFTQNSLGQSKNPIDSDHGIYRDQSARSRANSRRLDSERFRSVPRTGSLTTGSLSGRPSILI
jgi:hypothetical protein